MLQWETLLCPQRAGAQGKSNNRYNTGRTDFQRDYDRIIFSSPFRRLQNKTQVFPLPETVFVHNRLTHSLEVSSVGRSLGKTISQKLLRQSSIKENSIVTEIPDIVAAACLAHDMGNPPFGHSGEESIRQFFTENRAKLEKYFDEWEWLDLSKFEGNANALRLLTQQLKGRRIGGFRLSYAVLASIAKYPYPATYGKKKFGYFKSEREIFRDIAHQTGLIETEEGKFCRHPLVYLVEAADDICYQIIDVEDAHKLKILSTEETQELFMRFLAEDNGNQSDYIKQTLREVNDTNEKIAFLRAIVIGKLVEECSREFIQSYDEIMQGKPIGSLINRLTGNISRAMEEVKRVSIEKIYNNRHVVEIEIAGYKILSELLETFIDATLHSKSNLSEKIISLIPEQYRIDSEKAYERVMGVVDFISGMTDSYALKTYRLLKGISLPDI